jgi:hypothetical protein
MSEKSVIPEYVKVFENIPVKGHPFQYILPWRDDESPKSLHAGTDP